MGIYFRDILLIRISRDGNNCIAGAQRLKMASLSEDDFSCPVCKEIFKKPVVLSCIHVTSVCSNGAGADPDLWRVKVLKDFIRNILICVLKMNEGLTGLKRHEDE
uniref:Uncharacterized protein n=1 Tax=Cyprinus carpio TaxID=7962 RepID=A0A8C1UMC0_CYPCA